MKAILAAVVCFVVFAACTKEPVTRNAQEPDFPVKDTISYLALGDSYTIGESVSARSSFPLQLADSLRKQGVLIQGLTVIAQTGWTTGDLKAAIATENLTQKFDIVTLLIGVNNQYRGYSQVAYREEFVELLKTAINFAHGNAAKVIVISIPDWGATPFGGSGSNKDISNQIDQFNQINKEETLKFQANYTDITSISREAVKNPSLVAEDGLHPSEKTYALWVQQLMVKLRGAL